MKKLIFLTVPLLFACDQVEPIIEEPETKEIEKISWPYIFDKEDMEYLVYFYSEECGYCRSIKDEVLEYYASTTYKMYFLDLLDNEDVVIKHGGGTPVGLNSIEDLFILGTPSLMKIEDKTVSEYYAGVQAIHDFISSVEEDNFLY